MAEPGPSGYGMTIKERVTLLARAEEDPHFAALLYVKCSRDIGFFVDLCLWTFDPRIRDKVKRHIPFRLFRRQRLFVYKVRDAIEEGYDLLTEKSRDTGATWCILAVVLHGWIFESGFQALIGSRKEDQVDKPGDPSSMFWKLAYMIERLPYWAKPPGFTNKPPYRTFLKLENPSNGATITGESSNEDFGRGGRYTVIFPDEFASWEFAAPAWTSCSESTTCRLPTSTPKGMNFFGRLANERDPEMAIAKFRLHWKDDPRHVLEVWSDRLKKMINPWYERQKKRFGYDPTMLAQELEVDYNRSVKGRVYPQVDYSGIGRYPYDPRLPLYISWDFGRTDKTAIIWTQWNTQANRFRCIDFYQNSGQVISFYIPFVTGVIPTGLPYEYNEAEIAKIQSHRGWVAEEHFGDPAGRQRNPVTNTSVIDDLAVPRPQAGAPNGIYVVTNTMAVSHEVRRTATQKMLMRTDFDEEHCGYLLDAVRNCRYPDMVEGTSSTTVVGRLPVHDWTSHPTTALEFLAVNQQHTDDVYSDDERVDDGEAIRSDGVGTWIAGRYVAGGLPNPRHPGNTGRPPAISRGGPGGYG